MYVKIWVETDMPSCDGYRLKCTHALPEKYPDKKSAVKALKGLAENNFNFSKYRMKTVTDITKIDDYKYVVSYDRNDVTDTYYVP